MNIDKDTRVIILPKLANESEKTDTNQTQEYKIINLPTPSDLTKFKSYLIYEKSNKIYELNIIKGENSSITLKNGDAVKSIIIESIDPQLNGGGGGGVLQSANIIIGSAFNFTFLLISIFERHVENFNNLFKTIEDIRDSLSSLEGDWIYEINYDIYKQNLNNICDEILENDTLFYKYCSRKSIEWINNKILSLQNYILTSSNNNTILRKIILELNDSTQLNHIIDENLIKQNSLIYSIDYICDSYLPFMKEKLIDYYNYDFHLVENYLIELKQKQKNLEIIENNMNEINSITANTINNKNKNNNKKKNGSKNQSKKVAVGKGALDGFFKKA
ncbi:uncharacterized protein KGF55_005505 [Candida pseudojiufengensis]|uniref:uncharacterized protein n=1 Tax=Candida pseudojiufengensis TaxID=497109 RepID=UPI002224DEB2|nr:uncharacterized protein KGF55_005505 [Candida pseudojiufengensis]KAI5959162.1 hypothetical protein KGF55_005505 [Candida pseudojiufengensis]